MDSQQPNPNELTDLERRLTGWRPDAVGLDPDAMLFAAGRASVRPGPARFVWPAIAAGLAVVALGLGGWGARERTERLALARLMHQPAQDPPTAAPESPEPPAPGSFFDLSQQIRKDPEGFLARAPAAAIPPGNPAVAPAPRHLRPIDSGTIFP